MHGDGSLSAIAEYSAPAPGRPGAATLKTLVVGTLLQGLALAPIHFITPLQTGQVLPVAATLAAALTGFLFARAARQRPIWVQLRGGAATAALTGALGALGSAGLGHLAFELMPVAVATSAVAGLSGALIGRLVTRRRVPGG